MSTFDENRRAAYDLLIMYLERMDDPMKVREIVELITGSNLIIQSTLWGIMTGMFAGTFTNVPKLQDIMLKIIRNAYSREFPQ